MTLLELLGLLRKNIKLVVALPLVCAVAMALVSFFVLPKVYTAETSVYALVGKTSSSAAINDAAAEDLTYQDLQSSQLLANDFASLAETHPYFAFLVADDNQGAEREVLAAFHNLAGTVDGDDSLFVFLILCDGTHEIAGVDRRFFVLRLVQLICHG